MDAVNAATDQTNLNALNTYTGVTTVKSGILNILNWANGGVASGLGKSTNAASNLVLNGGTLQLTQGINNSQSTDRLFTLGANGGDIDVTATSTTVGLWFTNTGAIAYSTPNVAENLTLSGTKGRHGPRR